MRGADLDRRELLRLAGLAGGALTASALLRGAVRVRAADADGPILANLAVLLDQAAYLHNQLVVSTTGPLHGASGSPAAATSSTAASTSAGSASATSASAAATGQTGSGTSSSTSSSSSAAAPLDPLTVIAGFHDQIVLQRDTVARAARLHGAVVATLDADYPLLLPAGSDPGAALTALLTGQATVLGGEYGAIRALTSATAAAVAGLFAASARQQAVLLLAAHRPPVPQSFVSGDAHAAEAVVAAPAAATAQPSRTP